MLRPYTGTPPDQFLTSQTLRFFDVRLIECVDAETFAERFGRVLPTQELTAEIERVRGELRWSGRLQIRQRRVEGIVDDPLDASLPDLQTAGPAEFSADPLDLGREFLRWEYATKALCERLGVNAFDQPDVEEAKRLAREELVGGRPGVGAQHAAPLPTLTPDQLLHQARPGDYF